VKRKKNRFWRKKIQIFLVIRPILFANGNRLFIVTNLSERQGIIFDTVQIQVVRIDTVFA